MIRRRARKSAPRPISRYYFRMPGQVLVHRSDSIATVTLSHPGRLNAMTLNMWRDLGRVFGELSEDETLRCIVLRGDGDRAFAAGADIAEFAHERSNVGQARIYGREIQSAMDAVRKARHPTVALIQGVCVGGGLEVAAVCDLRICAASSRFGVPVKNLGLVMGLGELQGLIGLVGRAIALEIVLEGRVFDAAEAKDKGLVNRVVPDDRVVDEAYATAQRIADGAPLVARWHKRFAERLSDPRPWSEEEFDESFACFGTEDFQIGYRAFLAKEKPDFKGR
jgi:enoyl-CoA hydratase